MASSDRRSKADHCLSAAAAQSAVLAFCSWCGPSSPSGGNSVRARRERVGGVRKDLSLGIKNTADYEMILTTQNEACAAALLSPLYVAPLVSQPLNPADPSFVPMDAPGAKSNASWSSCPLAVMCRLSEPDW